MLRLVLAWLLLGLVAVPAAHAASTTQILRDCADDGVLQGTYTTSELRKARKRIPADTDQYTDCRDVLARAAASGVAGSRSGSSGGGALPGGAGGAGAGVPVAPTTDADRKALADAARQGGSAVDVGGEPIVPGAAGFAPSAARNPLPTTLIVLLTLLALAALAALVPHARRARPARLGSAIANLRDHVVRRRAT